MFLSPTLLYSSLLLILLLFGDDVKRIGTLAGLGDDAEMLHAARDGDVKKVVDFLTNKKVSLTTKNNYGVSAIIFAANNGHLEVVRELLDRGANIEDRSNNLKTPLLWASLWGHYDVVEHLVERGANISVKDREGLTPLMSSVMNNHIKITHFLLEHGANALTKNYYNGTALSIAKGRGNAEMIKILAPYYPPEPETSPYKILFNLIIEQGLMYTQIVIDVSCSIFGWKAIPVEQLPMVLKSEAMKGFPTVRETVAIIIKNVVEAIRLYTPIAKQYILDTASLLNEKAMQIYWTVITNWPPLQAQIEQHVQVLIDIVLQTVQSHYRSVFPAPVSSNSTSLNPDFIEASVGGEL